MDERIIASFEKVWEKILVLTPNILAGVIIILVFLFIGIGFQRLIRKRMKARGKENIVTSFLSGLVKWVLFILGLVIASDLMGFGKVAASLMAGAGISAIIIGFAFKDIAGNFLSGALLAINRPFQVGDIIQIGNFKGPVKDIDMRNTHIRTLDGRDIYVPNTMMITDVLTNFTRDGLIRLEFIAGLDVEDDIEAAQKLILRHFDDDKVILKTPQANVIVEEIGVNSIDLKIFFWINLFNQRSEEQVMIGEPVRSRVIREVKELLLANGFSLPSNIIEHKMFREGKSLEVKLEK